ncbi:MAG: hemolysin family protein [Prevotellaceae bacterium]|nr:hemolysin family protein [Prevotellaceae bacterium]
MELLIILGLILLNGIFAMYEIALISVRKSGLESEAKKGNRSAKKALKLSNDPNKFLSTIQIGITLTGIMTGLFSGRHIASDLAAVVEKIAVLAPYARGIAETAVIIAATYLTLVLGELVPKRLGLSRSNRITKLMITPMLLFSIAASPLVKLLSKSTSLLVKLLRIKENDEKITEEEIKAIVKEGFDDGEVQEVEHDIVERVFNLGDRDVDSIMTHRSDIVSLDIKDSKPAIKEKVCAEMHNVYPVVSNSCDNILGVVSLKDLFAHFDAVDFSLEKLIVPAQFFPENQSVYNVLERFKQTGQKYGFIIDEFGDIQGIVTVGDILQALVGRRQTDDEAAYIVDREDGSLLVDGKCSFYDFLEYLDLRDLYTENDYNTLSGFVLSELEHIPKTGEKFIWKNLVFEIMDMDGVRIDKILVSELKD